MRNTTHNTPKEILVWAIENIVHRNTNRKVVAFHGEANRYAYKLNDGTWLTIPFPTLNSLAGLGVSDEGDNKDLSN